MPILTTLRYLLMPLRGPSLLLIVIFSLLLLLAASGGILGLPLAFLVVSWFFKYAFALLDDICDGRKEPPVLSYEMVNPFNEQRPLALALVMTAFYFATGYAEALIGSGAVTVLRLAGLLILPAIVAIQAVTSGVLPSLDPRAHVRLIAQLRGSYVLILICVALFWMIGRGLLALSAAGELPRAIDIPLPQGLRLALLMYAWLAVFALIGGVMFESRHELGLEPSHSPEREQHRAQTELSHTRDQFMQGVFAEWRGGAFGNAWRTIETHLQQSADRPGDLRWMFDRAAQWSDPRLATRLAQELVPPLLASRRSGEAVDVARSQMKRDPAFRPLQATHAIRLAELARDAGDRPTARALLQDFASRYPGDPAQKTAVELAQQLIR